MVPPLLLPIAATAAATAVLLMLVLLPVAASAKRVSNLYDSTVIPKPRALPADTVVRDARGRRLATFHGPADRMPIPLGRIPLRMRQAVIAAEDEGFYHEGGVSFRGLVRAAWVDLIRHAPVQGGSTITQQYVKDVYTGDRRTIGRKIREAIIAEKLSHRLTKDQILSRYLNEVYFGESAYGVQAAALTYFGIPAERLNTLQAATLAGLISAPSRFDPMVHPRAARARRNYVLRRMVATGDLTAARAAALRQRPVTISPAPTKPSVAPYFLSYVTRVLDARFGPDAATSGGLRVTTTLDRAMQHDAEAAIAGHLVQPTDPSAALVAIDPATGAIRALVGGNSFRDTQFNLATQAHRQAGSSFKPFTLSAAMQQGISLLSQWHGPPSITVNDPRCFTTDPTTGVYGPWHVSNYADESAGTMNLLDATANSVNTIFSQLVLDVGPDKVAATAHAMGIGSQLQPVCSITLGTQAVTPLEMANGYATLADGGVFHRATPIQEVSSIGGRTLYRAPGRGHVAITPTSAALVTRALEGVITSGTGTAAAIGRPAAGKTGTAQNFQDAWFCGYVPQLAACVWVGYPQGEIPMHGVEGFPDVFGGSLPAEIWHDFMAKAVAGMPVQTFSAVSLAGYDLTPPGSVGGTPLQVSGLSSGNSPGSAPPAKQPPPHQKPGPPPKKKGK